LPPIAGLDIAHAAQWLGVMPQEGNPMLRQWASQAGLVAPSAGDPERVGASALDAPLGDPANTQHPNPESN
jgi:hypothetical protein